MFLRNCWYAAAFADEVGQSLLPRTILGHDLVMYRTSDGTPVVLDDECAHRGLPLSMGRLVGDDVQCGYHGLVYDRCGRCVRVPSQKSAPRGASVRAYPAVDRFGFVWAWMGEPALADEGLLPDYSGIDDDNRLRTRLHLVLGCNYQLHIDNLLDLSHIAYVHGTTTGNEDVGENTDTETERDGDTVRVYRRQSNVAPPELFRVFGGFDGPVDMWQVTEFNPPTYVHLSYGSAPAGQTDVAERDIWSHGDWGMEVFQGVTPETERSSHQMRYIMVDRGEGNETSFAALCRMLDQVSLEDAPVLARQQQVLERKGGDAIRDFMSRAPIKADQGLIHARQIIDERLHREAEASAATASQAAE